jgi:hypothetical protein
MAKRELTTFHFYLTKTKQILVHYFEQTYR